jgi:predicted peptidase
MADAARFVNRSLSFAQRDRPYTVYLPRGYEAEREWPLLLFLHGKGERGDDGRAQLEVGIGPALVRQPERFPCLVALPQCPADRRWHEVEGLIDAVLDAVCAAYPVDQARIVLTGISMGGFGTFSYGSRHAARFAAMVPICGGGEPQQAVALATRPLWVFHGARDDVIDVERSRQMVAAVRGAGGDVRYTEYPDEGHASWDRAYSEPELMPWLLAQRTRDPTPSSRAVTPRAG